MDFSLPSFAGRVGVAREDITPPVGIYARSWGAARHDVAAGVHRPLTLTALAILPENESAPLVLLALDLGWFKSNEDEWRLRASVLDELGLHPSRLLITLAHTHAGPSLYREDRERPGGHLIEGYLDELREKAVRAARSSIASARPAIVSWEYGHAGLAHDRDFVDPSDGRIFCGFNPGRSADQTLLVGRISSDDGGCLATIVNYACHPTTLAWQNALLSPDWVGAMRETVEGATSAPCLFLQGASGDLGPREGYSGDLALADRNGRQVGFAALSILEGMLPARVDLRYHGPLESGAALAVWERAPASPSEVLCAKCVDVELALKELPTVIDIERELRSCADPIQAERLRRKRAVRRMVGNGTVAQAPLWTWRVGDALFVAHPNEAYSRLQTDLRSRYAKVPVVVMNLTNGGSAGYLPPSEFYERDMYQVWQTPFARGGLETLIAACVSAIDELGDAPAKPHPLRR